MDDWTIIERLIAFGIFGTLLCAVLGVGAWWADRELERSRRRLPNPNPAAIVRNRLWR